MIGVASRFTCSTWLLVVEDTLTLFGLIVIENTIWMKPLTSTTSPTPPAAHGTNPPNVKGTVAVVVG